MDAHQLITYNLSGKAAAYLIDALLQEAPNIEQVVRDLQKEVGSQKITVDGGFVVIECQEDDKESIYPIRDQYAAMHPDLDFFVQQVSPSQEPMSNTTIHTHQRRSQ